MDLLISSVLIKGLGRSVVILFRNGKSEKKVNREAMYFEKRQQEAGATMSAEDVPELLR